MKLCSGRLLGFLCAGCLLASARGLRGGNLDTIGVTLLRQVDPTLTGSGVNVAQAEAPTSSDMPMPFEVNPAAVGQPSSLFTYISDSGTATTFPNTVGAESGHADSVGWNFFSVTGGTADQVSHVDNYEASYFYNSIIAAPAPPSISGRVVNQSFIFTGLSGSQQAAIEQNYDNYAAYNGTLFASGAGNGGSVSAPSTCYNGLSVGVYGASSSVGPTADGRCKPDLTAPGGATSFSTPYVAGAAALLLQAAGRGDGGTPTFQPSDLRTLKALLLNGAIKPGDWTNGWSWPLDARYGAGMLNVFNAWKQMTGGRHAYIESTTNAVGSPHPPGANPNNEPVLVGWDYNGIANVLVAGNYQERVNHYYFNWDPTLGTSFTLTATLAWNRLSGRSTINDLNLFLFNTANGNLITCSTSAVNNVEHLFHAALPPGRYDLQVQKDPTGQVSASETYALAFAFFNLNLSVTPSNGLAIVSWPMFPAGFSLQSTASLVVPGSWSPVNLPVTIANNQNVVTVPAGGAQQFFRLQGP